MSYDYNGKQHPDPAQDFHVTPRHTYRPDISSTPYPSERPYNDSPDLPYGTPDNLYQQKGKALRTRLLHWLVVLLFALLTIGITIVIPIHYRAVYQTYRQGTCTITDETINETHDKSGNVTGYTPHFWYNIQATNGEQASTEGYDGPFTATYSDLSDAQAIVHQYLVGQTVACWYNPAHISKALLVFYGYTDSDAQLNAFVALVLTTLFLIPIAFLLDLGLWKPFALAKRGVVATGKVLRTERRNTRSGHYMVSIIQFRTFEQPERPRQITIHGALKIGESVPVCYDPYYPRYAQRGKRPTTTTPVLAILTIGVLVLPGLICLYLAWMLP